MPPRTGQLPSAADYLAWYQQDIGADSDTVKKVQTQLRQFAAFCARRFEPGGNRAASGSSSGSRTRVTRRRRKEPALTQTEAATLLEEGINAALPPDRRDAAVHRECDRANWSHWSGATSSSSARLSVVEIRGTAHNNQRAEQPQRIETYP